MTKQDEWKLLSSMHLFCSLSPVNTVLPNKFYEITSLESSQVLSKTPKGTEGKFV